MKFYKHIETGEIIPQWMIKKKQHHLYTELSELEAQPLNIDTIEQHLSKIAGDVSNIATIVIIIFILGLIGAALTIIQMI